MDSKRSTSASNMLFTTISGKALRSLDNSSSFGKSLIDLGPFDHSLLPKTIATV